MLDIESPLCLPSLTVGLLTQLGTTGVVLCDWGTTLQTKLLHSVQSKNHIVFSYRPANHISAF